VPFASRRRRILFFIALGLVLSVLLIISSRICISAYILDGVLVGRCPDGKLVQSLFLDAQRLRRKGEGTVRVGARASYTVATSDQEVQVAVRRISADVFLVKPKTDQSPEQETHLVPKKSWREDGEHALLAEIALPEIPDGEYLLRAKVKSPLGETKVDATLPVFAPARVHVMTDRPLYEPGNTVQFRALVLRARDLAPLDGRPGRWIVQDPSGEVVLEERSPAGDFGVASGSFPLDQGAPTGDWRVRWVSGAAEQAAQFRVEPFTLPRFRVEASAPKPYYRSGDRPVLRGRVVYSSGAPVAKAQVDLAWSSAGAWPPPTSWIQGGGLPAKAETDANGGFELRLPLVPGDLRGRVTLSANIGATDPAGDRVEGAAQILLSEDAIQVETVTELEDGLVGGFNNRVFLRATTAAGSVLAKTKLTVRRAWDPKDKGVSAETDEDGVAQLQLDPGSPVNVVIPAMPARLPPKPPTVTRGSVEDLLSGQSPSLADQRAMDAWNAPLAPCARFIESGGDSVTVGLEIDPAGAIKNIAVGSRPIDRCVASVLKGKRLAVPRMRILQAQFSFQVDLPSIAHTTNGSPAVPAEIESALSRALLDARSCLPEDIESLSMRRAMIWKTTPGKKPVEVSFVPAGSEGESFVSEHVEACVESKLKNLRLERAVKAGTEEDDEEAPSGRAIGVARFSVSPSSRTGVSVGQATTLLGYELKIEARAGDEDVGSTKIVLRPGNVPSVRLRATPVLAESGQDVEIAILRGPGFQGKLPEKIFMSWEKGSIEGKVDPKSRSAKIKLPDAATGWFETNWSGGRALIYVRPKAQLAVSVRPAKERYAPGQTAELAIQTESGGKGAKAAVGLIGVDQSLAQLVPLPGPDALSSVRPKAQMSSPAFGVLDAEALTMGRIRGNNAAVATVMRVMRVPAIEELDTTISTSASPTFNPLEALTDHFYVVLAELHQQVRAWEEKAPQGEEMQPKLMAKLWEQAIQKCIENKQDVTDAYGRKLRLHRLPPDLLALTDPRVVVVNGTRLPEDVENWPAWVQKERP
jgi:hypothetical protein